jgi:hypothetical protein
MAAANNRLFFRNLVQTLGVTAVLFLVACAAPQSKSPEEPEQTVADASEQVSEPEVIDTYEGDGMEIPLDGSSLEAWDVSMARVKRHSTEASFTTLNNAITYLLVYDLEVRRDKEKLVAKLNGLTGYEVVAKVGWRKPPPGKSKAVKGAADAKIIET